MQSNHGLHAAFVCLAFVAAPLAAQDLLFYRFDDNYGGKAINYAAGSPAPAQGTLVMTSPGPAWVPGRFGSALNGGITSPIQYNSVNTGWAPGTITGSISYALWVRVANAQPAAFCYLFGAQSAGSFRVFTGAGGQFFTSGFTGAPTSTTNVYALANVAWTHVAMVADATVLTVTYYINGVPEAPKALTVVPSWTSTLNFFVGQQIASSAGSIYAIDEFLLTRRALTAAEVQTLAGSSRAGDGGYGGGCGSVTLASSGGVPSIGNAGYQLTFGSATTLSFAIGIGSNRASLGAVPLPFDLGTIITGIGVCFVDSAIDVTTLPGAKGPGTAVVPFPVPANAAVSGLTLFLQGFGIGSGAPIDLSNAFSVGLGY